MRSAMMCRVTFGGSLRIRLVIIALVCAFGCACAEPKSAPPLINPSLDGGLDGRVGDAARDAVYVRPDGGPALPGVDSEITLPFLAPQQSVSIEIEAQLRTLDVHFSIDTSASFGEEIRVLQDDLSDEIVPQLRRRIDDVSVGVSSFEDFPESPFGTAGDMPFELRTPITSSLSRVDAALARLNRPIGNGGDGPESGAEALYQVATGEGYSHDGKRYIAAYDGRMLIGGGTLGGVGFREGALRVVVHITDALSHTPNDYAPRLPGTRSMEQAAEALSSVGARTLGIISNPDVRAEMQAVAIATDAVIDPIDGECRTGIDGAAREPLDGRCPLVFDVGGDGVGLTETLTDAIVSLVGGVAVRRAYTEVVDDPLHFITAIEALEAEVPDDTPRPGLADERPNDGIDDTFTNVRPGVRLRFAVQLRNQLLIEDDAPQFYALKINLLGDGISLGTHTIRVRIPARDTTASSDAGHDARPQDDAAGM